MDIRTFKIDSDAENVTLTAYLSVRSRELPYNEKRDAVLVCPGGGYHGCSAREAEPVALVFQAKGYNTFILDYVHGADRVHPGPLLDLCKAVRMLKEKADEFRIPDLCRLPYRNSVRGRRLLDRCLDHGFPSSLRLVHLRDNTDHLISAFNQGIKGRNREIRSSHIDDALFSKAA